MTNRSCPLFVYLQKLCSGSEHSYAVVLGSINECHTDRTEMITENICS